MVDSLVALAVEKLGDLLIQEVAFLQYVRDEVDELKKELKMMQGFLKDAEEKQAGDHRVRQWISEVRDIAYDTEDVIDTFILEMGDPPKRGGSLASVKKYCSCIFSTDPIKIHKIGKEIKTLRKRLASIRQRREDYGIRDIGDVREGSGQEMGKLKQLRRTSSYDEEHVVGFEDVTVLLINELLKEEPRRCVISILGMGGLGKTTLARKLYHHREIEGKFEHRTWISVSQEYGIHDLLRRIIRDSLFKYKDVSLVQYRKEESLSAEKQENRREKMKKKEEKIRRKELETLTEGQKGKLETLTQGQKDELETLRKKKEELEILETMTEEEMERHLRNLLKGRRYLVVIDDVWDKKAWLSLRRAFPDDNNGSRVIVTTRKKDVAEISDERTHTHELRFLSVDESWELFCKKAFPKYNATDGESTSRCPPGLQMLGREMVGKCRGLPLAIIALGGLLSRKQSHEWYKIKEHIWQDLKSDSIETETILALSFNDLSYLLKACFLYLGLFPEDFEISTWKLIRLWVAEGFIAPEESLTEEEVAEEWLKELIGRSLIQVAKKSWEGITRCRVHDLLRDLAVSKAKEINFLHIYDGNIINPASSSNTKTSYRRQAAYSTIERYVSVDYSNPHLRTLLFFDPDSEQSKIELLQFIHARFKLLRVLDLQSIRFDWSRTSLPDAVGELIFLRYLGLKNTGIAELRPSIIKLQALQTLDASCGNPVRLDGGVDICKLKQLRHVIGHFEGITTYQVNLLTNLQTLRFVDIQVWISVNPGNLVNLRDLEIRSSRRGGPGEFTWGHIANFKNLQYLTVQLDSSMYFPSFQPRHCWPHLLQLKLDGRVENLPAHMHECLPNLKYLELKESELMQDPMPTLEKMQNLMVLEIREQRHLKKLIFTENGFPRLEVLMLYWLYSLKELVLEEGTMPMLKALTIHPSGGVMVPERLNSIPGAHNFKRDRD